MEAREYDLGVVRYFAVMTIVWGVVGMAVGLLLAGQLAWPALNFDTSFLSYGRIRPLHTNAVISAFVGCALMGSALYIVQKTCQTALFSNGLAWFVFWGWQLVILSAAITLPLGYTSSKEYAELEWPIDILIAIVWVSFGIVFFGIMYYFAPKQAGQPVYSYRLSIVHPGHSLRSMCGLARTTCTTPRCQTGRRASAW